MEDTKILITVKTYPLPSKSHLETVCTAGICEDGRWVRLYPVSFRQMDKEQRFSKYQWIQVPLIKDTRDPRPESYKLAGSIIPLNKLDTNQLWDKRKEIVLNQVYTNLQLLINEARDTSIFTSLATFKPEKIISFQVINNHSIHEKKIQHKVLEMQLGKEIGKRLAEKVPYSFYYIFTDDSGKRSRMQILDWEIYQLTRKLIHKYRGNKGMIYSHLKAKYFDEFTQNRDLYFFLGTHKYWHIRRSTNPFMIVGIFYPPKQDIVIH
ncbi:MAG: hypothetical protein IPP74_07875 [Alphaproteobacteria bacterium]|nr:hypothetical protein [Alphaproteobacteria bacterium]